MLSLGYLHRAHRRQGRPGKEDKRPGWGWEGPQWGTHQTCMLLDTTLEAAFLATLTGAATGARPQTGALAAAGLENWVRFRAAIGRVGLAWSVRTWGVLQRLFGLWRLGVGKEPARSCGPRFRAVLCCPAARLAANGHCITLRGQEALHR